MPSERTGLHVGDHVQDRDDDDATLVVVALSPQQASEYAVGEDATVATYNEDYPADDDVVEVVYARRTTADIENVQRYAFPRSRLSLETPVHDIEGRESDNRNDVGVKHCDESPPTWDDVEEDN